MGLPFWEIMQEPLDTLVGNRVRSWALFDQLTGYGMDTFLFVEANAKVDPQILSAHENNFIRDEQEFIQKAKTEFDYVLLCSTKIETMVVLQPWIQKISHSKMIGAFCYHNTRMAKAMTFKKLFDQIVAAAFVSPVHQMNWKKQKWAAPTFQLTTGQSQQLDLVKEGDKDTVFVGEIRSLDKLKLICDIAEACSDRTHYVVCPKILEQQKGNLVHLDFLKMEVAARRPALEEFLRMHKCSLPENLVLDVVPIGEEQVLMDKVGIALDFSWNDRYDLENSKVSRYLAYGLIPIVEMPSPSHRYLDLFGVGSKVEYGESPQVWVDTIKNVPLLDLPKRNNLRRKAGEFFGWDKVAFEMASIIYALEMKKSLEESLLQKLIRKVVKTFRNK